MLSCALLKGSLKAKFPTADCCWKPSSLDRNNQRHTLTLLHSVTMVIGSVPCSHGMFSGV